MEHLPKREGAPLSRYRQIALIFGVIICLTPLSVYFSSIATSAKHLLAFALLTPILMLSTIKSRWTQFIAVGAANIKLYFLATHVAILSPLLILVSHLFNSNKTEFFLKNQPIRKYFILFLVSLLPSLANSADPLKSLFMMNNLLSVFLLFELLAAQLQNGEDLSWLAKSFMFFTTMNSFSIFYQAMHTSDRIFGFSGVVFVDFSCITILIILSKFIFKNSINKIPLLIILAINFSALILTQTRNTLVSLMLCLSTIFIYGFFSKNVFGNKKLFLIKRTIGALTIFSLLVGVFFIARPNVFQRHKSLLTTEKGVPAKPGAEVFTKSTTGTRALIWITASNAFLHHPIIGIGAYAFSFSSESYNILPKFLYQSFVQGLSPHITYLAVLCEGGVIGLSGFLLFIIISLRMSFKSVRISVTEEQKHLSLCILSLHLYVTYSMMLSDAWLFQQCAILWGLVLGASIANHKIISRISSQSIQVKQN